MLLRSQYFFLKSRFLERKKFINVNLNDQFYLATILRTHFVLTLKFERVSQRINLL